ncbi:hypothetical protein L226DRAFT_532152 [Lentinus tigrinus ALCF2SS1-7]|uniref:uncharacterized protein n=1 Tax=Lentinus tigrinus ALCF2SS1-7 TaxID=1328758 RepID=UPI0011662967|nr:hypothetical protein L226DRAFT_532152 [Lentinus tigrinus ALCF2SS1-7]
MMAGRISLPPTTVSHHRAHRASSFFVPVVSWITLRSASISGTTRYVAYRMIEGGLAFHPSFARVTILEATSFTLAMSRSYLRDVYKGTERWHKGAGRCHEAQNREQGIDLVLLLALSCFCARVRG